MSLMLSQMSNNAAIELEPHERSHPHQGLRSLLPFFIILEGGLLTTEAKTYTCASVLGTIKVLQTLL